MPDEKVVGSELSAAGVIGRIYHRLGLDQVSCAVVADELNALGVPTRYTLDGRGIRGQRTRGLWTAGRIRNMVINPVYQGELQYGRRTQKRQREVIAASIEPIVSPELWGATQATLARNRVCAKNTRRVYLLKSVIRCAVCRLTYVGSQGRAGIGWYRCNGRNRDRGPLAGRCTGPMVRTDSIEPVIWADIERFLRDPGVLLAELASEDERTSAVAEVDAIIMRRPLEALGEQERTAIGLVVRGILPEAALRPELERIERERATLEDRLAAVEAQGAPALPTVAPERLAEVRARLEAGLTDEQRQEIVRLLVAQIVISGETTVEGTRSTRAVVEYRFPGAVQTDTGMDSSRRPAGTARGRASRRRP